MAAALIDGSVLSDDVSVVDGRIAEVGLNQEGSGFGLPSLVALASRRLPANTAERRNCASGRRQQSHLTFADCRFVELTLFLTQLAPDCVQHRLARPDGAADITLVDVPESAAWPQSRSASASG